MLASQLVRSCQHSSYSYIIDASFTLVLPLIAVLPGLVFQEKFGAIGLVVYLGSIFSILASVMFLLLVVLLYRTLLPGLQPNKEYSSKCFFLRKWFMDHLFLSPMFRYASQCTLQTSSTFPCYLRLLGAKIGSNAWMNVSITSLCDTRAPIFCKTDSSNIAMATAGTATASLLSHRRSIFRIWIRHTHGASESDDNSEN